MAGAERTEMRDSRGWWSKQKTEPEHGGFFKDKNSGIYSE